MKSRYILAGILVLAFIVRVVNLSMPDMFTDEAAYAFRAIGSVDYVEAEDQTTPLEWFDESRTQIPNSIPWWTKLSFHDHPPLFFWTLHLSIKAFGETTFAVRFPSALFGVLAVYAVYGIGKRLGGEHLGLASALMLAITTNHLYISRIGLQESMLIALGFMGILAVFKAGDDTRQYLYAALWFGLGFLTKYNVVLFMAIAGIVIVVRGVRTLPWRTLAIMAGIFVVIISPVIIYNLMLYRAVGHFDFQFSYVFGQHPDVWKVTPGKEIGSLFLRLSSFGPAVVGTSSPLFLLLVGIGTIITFVRKNSLTTKLLLVSPVLMVAAYDICVIGVSYRFLTMLTPFLALLAGATIVMLHDKLPKILSGAVIISVIVIEIAYGMNSVARAIPYGKPTLTYAEQVHNEFVVTGYNELGRALEKDLAGFRPSRVFEMKYQFLTNRHQKVIDEQIGQGLEPQSLVVVYDPNIQNLAQLWYFDRFNIYHAWPVLNIDHYAEYAAKTKQSFPDADFKNHIFVIRAEGSMSRRAESLNSTGAQTEAGLKQRGLKPEIIYAPSGQEAFHIYRFTSSS